MQRLNHIFTQQTTPELCFLTMQLLYESSCQEKLVSLPYIQWPRSACASVASVNCSLYNYNHARSLNQAESLISCWVLKTRESDPNLFTNSSYTCLTFITDQPQCISCIEPFTVKRFLMDCVEWNQFFGGV